jgi:hypothetical protein
LTDVFLTLRPRGLQLIDAQPTDGCNEKRLRRSNVVSKRLLPANKRVLQNVFRVRNCAHHAVCDGEEQAPVLVECCQWIWSGGLWRLFVVRAVSGHTVKTAEKPPL